MLASGLLATHCRPHEAGVGRPSTQECAVRARRLPDYGDPQSSRYGHVDFKSTCIYCGKHATSLLKPGMAGSLRVWFNETILRMGSLYGLTPLKTDCYM
jgi:hypothetical protein